jgi:hypothetical protein
MVAQDFIPIELQLTRVGDKTPLAKTSRDITINSPAGIDKNYPYYSEVINSVKKSFINLNQ